MAKIEAYNLPQVFVLWVGTARLWVAARFTFFLRKWSGFLFLNTPEQQSGAETRRNRAAKEKDQISEDRLQTGPTKTHESKGMTKMR